MSLLQLRLRWVADSLVPAWAGHLHTMGRGADQLLSSNQGWTSHGWLNHAVLVDANMTAMDMGGVPSNSHGW